MTAIRRLMLASACAFALAACQQQESPEEVREDVAEKQREGAEAVMDAHEDVHETEADARKDVAEAVREGDPEEIVDAQAEGTRDLAEARYDESIALAEADYKVALERCDGLPVEQQPSCEQAAERDYEAARDAAEVLRKTRTEAADMAQDEYD